METKCVDFFESFLRDIRETDNKKEKGEKEKIFRNICKDFCKNKKKGCVEECAHNDVKFCFYSNKTNDSF